LQLKPDPLDGMAVEIRAARSTEAPVVSEVLSEAAVWLQDQGNPLWALDQVSVEQVAPDCEAGSFFLAWLGPAALGTMRLTDSDPHFWPEASSGEAVYLHKLAVRRSAAGGRVSSALLEHAAHIARRRRAPYLVSARQTACFRST
jgi:GNAT superfamily N-acetyltransferase